MLFQKNIEPRCTYCQPPPPVAPDFSKLKDEDFTL